MTPELENPTYFQISPQSLNFSLIDNSGHDTAINFCITPNGIHKDVEVVLAPYGPARPGFDATYLVTYKNKGNQTLSCDVSVQYNEDVLDFVRSTMSPSWINLSLPKITTPTLSSSRFNAIPFIFE